MDAKGSVASGFIHILYPLKRLRTIRSSRSESFKENYHGPTQDNQPHLDCPAGFFATFDEFDTDAAADEVLDLSEAEAEEGVALESNAVGKDTVEATPFRPCCPLRGSPE